MEIRNIVFDIGNVLADYRWHDYLQDKGFSSEMIDRIARASTLSPAWGEYDRGVLTTPEVIEGFVRNDPEIARELHLAFDDLHDLLRPFDYTIPLIRKLKAAGYRVFFLSNWSEQAIGDCADALTFLPEVDGGIFSYRVHLLKPDAAIYNLLLQTYDLKAEDCVFLDDMQPNVDGARRVGMQALRFSSLEQALGDLKTLGVAINW